MKEYIAQWIRSRNVLAVISHKTIKSLFYYEVFDYMGTDGKFYKFNVVYTDARILGTLNSLSSQNALTSPEESAEEYEVNKVLDAMVVSYDTKEELANNRSKVLDKEQLDAIVIQYFRRLIDSLVEVYTDNFSVQKAELVSDRFPVLSIYFTYKSKTQMPFRLVVSEESLVKIRDYGEDSPEFMEFVRSLGSITGGIVWH